MNGKELRGSATDALRLISKLLLVHLINTGGGQQISSLTLAGMS